LAALLDPSFAGLVFVVWVQSSVLSLLDLSDRLGVVADLGILLPLLSGELG
jgi:hypothetical protein